MFSALVFITSQAAGAAVNQGDVQSRIEQATTAFADLMSVSDRAVPNDLMKAAHCIASIELYKAGFIFGGQGGYGVATCRDADQKWSAPIFVDLSGVSFGLQIGLEKVDLTLVFANHNARDTLASTDVKLGGDVSLTVGPVGRDLSAGTDFKLEDAVYSYSTAKGIFGGLTINGSVMSPDRDYDAFVYGNLMPKDIFAISRQMVPASVTPYLQEIEKY